jgi:LacI family transcriptional regulator
MKQVKWVEIYRNLKEEINSKKYKRGDKFLRIKDICEKFKVSDITARRVLYELERENLIIQKPKIGTLIKSLGREIYMFTPFKIDDFKILSGLEYIKANILKGVIEEGLRENVEIKFVSEEFVLENFNSDNIFLILYHTLNPEIEKNLLKTERPTIIFLHTPISFKKVHTVRLDLYKGAYIATDYLIKKGYRRIGFITGSLSDEWFLSRFEGYVSALREKRIKFDMKLIKECNDVKEEVIERFKELLNLPEPPDAIFCANDRRALYILKYCKEKNIKVPDDIAICGFDNIPETETIEPPLTTTSTEFKKIGEEAVKLSVYISEGKLDEIKDILIEPELIERKTT